MKSEHYIIGEYTYKKDDFLGEGSFGKVYRGLNKFKNYVAIKIIPINKEKGPEINNEIINEIHILSKISHQNIVQFIEEKRDKDNLYLITEHCEYDLKCFLRNNPQNEEQCVQILQDIIKGYTYLNEHNITHRDIKLENILMKMHNGKYVAKISDYGFAKLLHPSAHLTDVIMTSVNVGCDVYNAPEIKTGIYNYTVDIYSIGIMFYIMLLGKPPQINDGKYTIDLTGKFMNENSYNFIVECIKQFPKRMHMKEVLAHRLIITPFVDDINAYKIQEKYEVSLS